MASDPSTSGRGDPRRIGRILRLVIGGLTAALLLYGLLRFSFVTVRRDFGWPDYTAGDKLVVDGFPSHGRSLQAGDFVTFAQGGEGDAVLGRLVGRRKGTGPTDEEVRAALAAALGRDITGEEAAFLLRQAGGTPRDGAWLAALAVEPPGGRWNLYLEWVDPDALLGRVIVRSPF